MTKQTTKQKVMRQHISSGFTLLEVLIAVTIFASAMVVLVGLQTASVQRAISDRDNTHAMLIAREILSAIEEFPGNLKNQDLTGQPSEVLSQFVNLPPIDTSSTDITRDDSRFAVRLTIEPWTISALPFLPPGAIQRIRVFVYWSDNPDHSLEVLYFLRTIQKNEDEDFDGDPSGSGGNNSDDDENSDDT